MTPDERVRYLKDLDHAEKHGEPKKGSFLERLIARGNKKTEDEIAAEAQARAQAEHARLHTEGSLAAAATQGTSDGVIR